MQTPQSYRSGYPLQRLFIPFPFVCFILAFATDIAFWRTVNLMWQNFSSWLLFAGLVFGAFAMVAAGIDLLRSSTRPLRPSPVGVVGFAVMLLLAFVNSFVHAGDGWTAVVPTGLALSGATFLVILLTLAFSASSNRALNWSTP